MGKEEGGRKSENGVCVWKGGGKGCRKEYKMA